MKVISFSPAHITGFFEVFYGKDEKNSGSRGAGISITLGSYATIELANKTSIVKKAKVTKDALSFFKKKFKVRIKNELPSSQGFGISASSTLAACMGAAHILSMPYKKAMEFAHIAEVKNKTGLGDVISSFYGGMEARVEQGLNGKIKKWDMNEKILIAVVGSPLKTKAVLENEKAVDRINEAGRHCLKEFLRKPSFNNFFYLSRTFAEESGLMDRKIKKLIDEANKIGMASMCMIGNSIFAKWSKEMKNFFMNKGKIYEGYIDNEGARILTSMSPFSSKEKVLHPKNPFLIKKGVSSPKKTDTLFPPALF